MQPTITREDIEFFCTHAEGVEIPLATRTSMYLLLVLNRIEGHLERLVENTSEIPELDAVVEKLSHISSIILDK